MDYNKMMKFIENPITLNILQNHEGHINLDKHEHLQEEQVEDQIVADPNDIFTYIIKKSKQQLRFEKMLDSIMDNEKALQKMLDDIRHNKEVIKKELNSNESTTKLKKRVTIADPK